MNSNKQKVDVLCCGGMDSVAAHYQAARDFRRTNRWLFADHGEIKFHNRILFSGSWIKTAIIDAASLTDAY
jgi:hypothetical protein